MSHKYNSQISEKLITDIITRHFPDSNLLSFTEITNSFVNPVYSFNLESDDSYILKFNNPRWPNKQQREIESIALTKDKTSLPVPAIVAESPDNSEDIYMIQEKAKGIELREVISEQKLSSEDILKLIETIGSYLGELHSITFDFFGDISSVYTSVDQTKNYLWGNRFDNWIDCFRAFCLDILNWVDRESFPEYRVKLTEKIDNYIETLPETKTACFIHSDIQPSNILVDGNAISAIIDFEWSFAGAADFDYQMTKAGFYFSEFPAISKSSLYEKYDDLSIEQINSAFDSGYKSKITHKVKDYDEDFLDFTWLLYMVGSWNWITQSSSETEIYEFRKQMHKLYKHLIFQL